MATGVMQLCRPGSAMSTLRGFGPRVVLVAQAPTGFTVFLFSVSFFPSPIIDIGLPVCVQRHAFRFLFLVCSRPPLRVPHRECSVGCYRSHCVVSCRFDIIHLPCKRTRRYYMHGDWRYAIVSARQCDVYVTRLWAPRGLGGPGPDRFHRFPFFRFLFSLTDHRYRSSRLRAKSRVSFSVSCLLH